MYVKAFSSLISTCLVWKSFGLKLQESFVEMSKINLNYTCLFNTISSKVKKKPKSEQFFISVERVLGPWNITSILRKHEID